MFVFSLVGIFCKSDVSILSSRKFWDFDFLNHKNTRIAAIAATIKRTAIIPPTIAPTFVALEDLIEFMGWVGGGIVVGATYAENTYIYYKEESIKAFVGSKKFK